MIDRPFSVGYTAVGAGEQRRPGTRLALLPQRTSEIDTLPLTVAECVQIGRFRLRRRLTRDDRASVTQIMQ